MLETLSVLDLRAAAVSCLIVHKLNRCSIYGLVGAYSQYEFHALPIMVCDPHPLCTCGHYQSAVTKTNTFSAASFMYILSFCIFIKKSHEKIKCLKPLILVDMCSHLGFK